jgi:hypothetical protein
VIDAPAAMYAESEHALIVRRERSSRLVIVFPGIGQRMQGVAPLQFLKQSGLEGNNLILLRDTRRTSFLFGCSADLPTFDAMLAWLAAQVADFRHVSQVLCIGVSSGSLASMVTAEQLPAACSVNFGPRFQSMAEVAAMFASHPPPVGAPPALAGTAQIRLTAADRTKAALLAVESRLRDALGLPVREWSPTAIINASVRDSGPLLRRVGTNLVPSHHLYYVASNKRDRLCVRYLRERASNVVPHPVEPVPGCQTRRLRWDHDVVPILITAGRLKATITAALHGAAI